MSRKFEENLLKFLFKKLPILTAVFFFQEMD